jgi:hypothetical protein
VENIATEEEASVNTLVSPDTLRRIAEEVLEAKAKPVEEVEVNPVDVDKAVSEIVEFMIASAQEGLMSFTYPMGDKSKEMLDAVAAVLRKMYPAKMQIIKSGGTNSLTFNWSGNIRR